MAATTGPDARRKPGGGHGRDEIRWLCQNGRALTKTQTEHSFSDERRHGLLSVTIAAGRADCPRFDRPAGQRVNLHLITKEGVRMTSPVFRAVVARSFCANDSRFWEVVDGYAFKWWQVAGPKALGLWS
jgi:hypothetical protein